AAIPEQIRQRMSHSIESDAPSHQVPSSREKIPTWRLHSQNELHKRPEIAEQVVRCANPPLTRSAPAIPIRRTKPLSQGLSYDNSDCVSPYLTYGCIMIS